MDEGSAVAEYVMVLALASILFGIILQVLSLIHI